LTNQCWRDYRDILSRYHGITTSYAPVFAVTAVTVWIPIPQESCGILPLPLPCNTLLLGLPLVNHWSILTYAYHTMTMTQCAYHCMTISRPAAATQI